MKILFINACVRKDSRTLRLCHHYLNLIKQTDPLKNCVIQTVNLQEKELRPLNEESLKLREEDINRQAFADSRYDCAKDFAAADLILIGAPYWDFSFPAALKIYFENICINRLTFYYDEQGIPNSLCHAAKVIYITTAGGYIGEHNTGAMYVKDLCSTLFGIKEFHAISAEGLDIQGNNIDNILNEAVEKINAAVKSLGSDI